MHLWQVEEMKTQRQEITWLCFNGKMPGSLGKVQVKQGPVSMEVPLPQWPTSKLEALQQEAFNVMPGKSM